MVTRRRDQDRAADDRPVDRFVPEDFEVFEGEVLLELAADRVDRPEGGDQEEGERAQVADDQPADRAGQQGPDLKAWTAVEEVGEPAAHRPPFHDRFSRHLSLLLNQPLIEVQAWTQSL